jgi:hypothetical protein
LQSERFSKVANRVLAGDFNTDIFNIEDILKTELNMTYSFENELPYNTENKLKYRNRDGHVGMSVINRCNDGVFIGGDFEVLSKLISDDKNFDRLANIQGLEEI